MPLIADTSRPGCRILSGSAWQTLEHSGSPFNTQDWHHPQRATSQVRVGAAEVGTLSCMSFHCFCQRVSGAIVIPPLVFTWSLRRESSYARVADVFGVSGSTAAATCT